MSKNYIEDKKIEKLDLSGASLEKGDYEHCTFLNCNFSGTDLSNINFTDCEFKGCNLSTAKISNTAFRNARFIDCKMLGMHFENCNDFLFSVYFENCQLNLSSFYKRNIRKNIFKNVNLHEVDFTETDAAGAVFENCDFNRAVFSKTILEKADFRSSFNYSIDPDLNKIKKAKFSKEGISGLLDKYDIELF